MLVDIIPISHPVQPLGKSDDGRRQGIATCGYCMLKWNDDKSTSMTPAPAGRCPFEMFHLYPDETK